MRLNIGENIFRQGEADPILVEAIDICEVLRWIKNKE